MPEVDPSLQGLCDANVEGSVQFGGTPVIPVICPVTEGPPKWLGLRCGTPLPLDGTGPGPSRVQANPKGPVNSHVGRGTASEESEGNLPVEAGDPWQRQAGTQYLSLAKEALTWLEAGDSTTTAPGGTGPSPGAETEVPAAIVGGITIDETDFTVEDFWSLLKDAGYETWLPRYGGWPVITTEALNGCNRIDKYKGTRVGRLTSQHMYHWLGHLMKI